MPPERIGEYFSKDVLTKLFPKKRTDQFFEALFGDATEGSFDISLALTGHAPEQNRLNFELQLHERAGKCLACNLTYGLPEVFSRHPIININGLVQEIEKAMNGRAKCTGWHLGSTKSKSGQLHVIPLVIELDN